MCWKLRNPPSYLNRVEPECSRPPRSKQAGTELLSDSHTEASTAALSEIKKKKKRVLFLFMRCLHSGSLSESGCLLKMAGTFQYMIPRKAPSELNGKLPRFIYISVISSTESRDAHSTNEPSMSALPPREIHPHPVEQRGIFLMPDAPYKTETSQPAELKPGYWYWLLLVLHPLLYSSDSTVSFSPLLLSRVMLQQQQHLQGALHVCHVGNMAQDKPIQLSLPFPGPN